MYATHTYIIVTYHPVTFCEYKNIHSTVLLTCKKLDFLKHLNTAFYEEGEYLHKCNAPLLK